MIIVAEAVARIINIVIAIAIGIAIDGQPVVELSERTGANAAL